VIERIGQFLAFIFGNTSELELDLPLLKPEVASAEQGVEAADAPPPPERSSPHPGRGISRDDSGRCPTSRPAWAPAGLASPGACARASVSPRPKPQWPPQRVPHSPLATERAAASPCNGRPATVAGSCHCRLRPGDRSSLTSPTRNCFTPGHTVSFVLRLWSVGRISGSSGQPSVSLIGGPGNQGPESVRTCWCRGGQGLRGSRAPACM